MTFIWCSHVSIAILFFTLKHTQIYSIGRVVVLPDTYVSIPFTCGDPERLKFGNGRSMLFGKINLNFRALK